MAPSFVPGPLLGQTFPLTDTVRVRLRLAHFNDRRAIAGLLARHGQDLLAREGGEPVESRWVADRLVQFDPRRRYVLCACALIDSSERLVGVGAIDLEGEDTGEPDLIVVDSELGESPDPLLTEALTGLLWGALVGAAQAAARSRAA
jgi:hypothetical protein